MAHILFVDDLRPQVENYIRTLEDKGHAVTLEKNAEAAMTTLDAQVVDLLVLDIHGIAPTSAPEPDIEKLVYGGLDLYKKVRADFPRLKIIIASIYTEDEIKTEAAFKVIRFTRTLFVVKGEFRLLMDAILQALSVDDDSLWPPRK